MLCSKVHGFAAAAAVFAQGALAAAPLWGQCGGNGWTGDTQCVSGATCSVTNEWYHQCIPGSGGAPPNQGTPTTPTTPTTTGGGGGSQTTSVAATYTVDPSLPGNTIYRPVDMKAFAKMPVLVWGNGACSADSLSHHNFLIEIASWGVIAIANGTPRGGGSTSAQTMTNAITWAANNAGKGTYANMVTSRLAAAGMSCGGIEAYAQAFDSRVTAIGIYNSGQYDAGGTQATVPRINKPIFFFMGGPTDIAYENLMDQGMRDYRAVSAGVPAWVGNLPVGHGGTYGDPKGGKFGTAGQHWARWLLRGDASAAAFFTGAGARNDGWTVESKSLDRLATTPI